MPADRDSDHFSVAIDAHGVYYRLLNQRVREAIARGEKEIYLKGVNGQYYIADGLRARDVTIVIEGVPGNDLGAFMDGPTVIVKGNGQDNIANTMNSGKIVIHGHAGDVLGYGMRGGKLFVKGDVGYRVGIHMKGYKDQVPAIVIGGRAGDFFGEYMAGGTMVLLGMSSTRSGHLNGGPPLVGSFCGTGMHGGAIFLRGEADQNLRRSLGKEVGIVLPDEKDMELLRVLIGEFCEEFDIPKEEVFDRPFTKLIPVSTRPYGNLYTY